MILQIIVALLTLTINQPAMADPAPRIPCTVIKGYIAIYGKGAALTYAESQYTPQQIAEIRKRCGV